jgi:hypothetical protein
MQVGCTRKLLDYIKVKAEPADQKADPLLSWSANIITMNRRRAIIVANDSSRYGFVLYGIKSKDIKELEGLLLDGVRTCLEVECIAPELIQQYMNDCGSKVTCTKTANPSAVARLNQLCLLASYIDAEMLTTEHLLQKQVLLSLNNDYIRSRKEHKRDYFLVYDQFAEDLSQRYGAHPYKCKAAEFEVELELESVCRRRVVVPLNYTFRQFHYVLQSLFNWERCHLHDFSIERYPNGQLKYSLVGYPRELEIANEITRPDESVQLSEIFPHYDYIIYSYDFGDDWTHHIRLLGIIDDYDKNHAVCLSGEGDAPPEDAGGYPGYARLLQVLADPEDPDYNNMKAWYQGMHCMPFDLDRVNRNVEKSLRAYGSW